MKLSSISLIASALAATAGNTIAAPGPLHARSLQQGNFERDIDRVDLFTRNPGDPERPWQPHLHDGWHYPVGPCRGLHPRPLVDSTKHHIPLADLGHHHAQDHVPPEPLVNPTRNHRQNVHGSSHAPPDHRHAEPGSSHVSDHRHAEPRPQHPNYTQQHPLTDHGHAEPRHPSQLPRSAQLLPAPIPQQSQHAIHPLSAPYSPPQDPQQRQSKAVISMRLAHDQQNAGRSLFRAQAVAQHAAIATNNPSKVTRYTTLADTFGRASDRHFVRAKTLWTNKNYQKRKDLETSAKNGKAKGEKQVEKLWNEMDAETKRGRPAKSEAIEQELIMHEWELWYEQRHPGRPGQHQ